MKELEGKRVKLIKSDGFVLYGKIVKSEQYGVLFQTKQKLSFISFSSIREITPDERVR